MKLIRTIITVIAIIINFILMTPFLIYSLSNHRKKTPEGYAKCERIAPHIIRYMVKTVQKTTGFKIEVFGEENIPQDRASVLIGNHQSYFDVIAGLICTDTMRAYLAKKEIYKIPFLGAWMETIDCVMLDRSNPKQAMGAFKQASENVRRGKSIIIFPEGTRSKTGEIGEFNAGAFMIATRTKAPVVPFLVEGSRDIFENNSMLLGPGTVRFTFFPPVETQGLSREEINGLSEAIRSKLIEEQAKRS